MAKEQLALQVQQLQNQLQDRNNWVENNSTALIAATATVIVALFGILQWAITVRQAQNKESRDRDLERQKEVAAQEKELKDRQAAHDKDLRAQAEERFKTAVTALGDKNEATQIGGAILLRSFLNEGDKEVYGRYYAQIFDLAVAYLRLSNTSLLTEDPYRIPLSPEDLPAPLPLTPLRQALIVVFREVFPRARQGTSLSLDATGIQLDYAYLTGANLKRARMPYSSLRKADFAFASLQEVYLRGSHLEGAGFVGAQLKEGNLTIAHLEGANLNGAHLEAANLGGSYLVGAHFRNAHLTGAQLGNADLSGADMGRANLRGIRNLEKARSLKNTNLRGVKGLSEEQKAAYKARGAIIDEVPTASLPQSADSASTPSQSTNVQTLSTQASLPTPDANGGSDSVSRQSDAAQIPAVVPTQVSTPPTSTDGSNAAAYQQGSGS